MGFVQAIKLKASFPFLGSLYDGGVGVGGEGYIPTVKTPNLLRSDWTQFTFNGRCSRSNLMTNLFNIKCACNRCFVEVRISVLVVMSCVYKQTLSALLVHS